MKEQLTPEIKFVKIENMNQRARDPRKPVKTRRTMDDKNCLH